MKKRIALYLTLIVIVALSACGTTDTVVKPTMTPGEWNYVVLGDSIAFGYPGLLKTGIEADFDGKTTISIYDSTVGGQSGSELLESIQTNKNLRDAIRDAELITFFIPMGGCRDALTAFENGGDCGGDDNQDCLRACFAVYKTDTTAIFAELVNLRPPSEALIRTHDLYQFHTSNCLENGIFEVINGYWQDGNAHVHATAERYDIPVANVYDAFMGEGGIQPPEDTGLVEKDMIHTTHAGKKLIADLLHELGYELAPPGDL